MEVVDQVMVCKPHMCSCTICTYKSYFISPEKHSSSGSKTWEHGTQLEVCVRVCMLTKPGVIVHWTGPLY